MQDNVIREEALVQNHAEFKQPLLWQRFHSRHVGDVQSIRFDHRAVRQPCLEVDSQVVCDAWVRNEPHKLDELEARCPHRHIHIRKEGAAEVKRGAQADFHIHYESVTER